MDLILKSSFADYFLDPSLELLVQKWHNQDELMDDDGYKAEMYNYLKFVRLLRTKRALIDLTQFNYTIVPEIQQWVDKNITRYATDIVRAIAFVFPENLFIQVSVKQVMREENAVYRNIEFFYTFDQALNWLKLH
jgi:hypothetical protein